MIGPGGEARNTLFVFAAVTSLFFAWGFITSNNDPLIAALRAAFALNYTQALLTQIVFFLAFGLLSLPAAWLSGRLGLVDTTLLALLVMAGGCVLVDLATNVGAFAPILVALFVIAAGYTALQVAANPLAAAMGRPDRSHFRLNFAQAFNSLGVVIGVHFGSLVMLGGAVPMASSRAELLSGIDQAYRIMAAFLVVLALLLVTVRRSLLRAAPVHEQTAGASLLNVLRSRWAVFGAVTIGLYVGAEVSIGSIMINFLNQPSTLGLSLEQAGRHLANLYWGGALVGRIVGTLLLTRVRAAYLLAICALVASSLCMIAVAAEGPLSAYAALGVGLFNSIMFPTIFSLTLERSNVPPSATSGLLCVAIVAGAVLPLAVGAMADRFGLGAAFVIPLAAYLVITAFAVAAGKRRLAGLTPEIVASGPPLH